MKFYRGRKDVVQEKLGKHYNLNRQGHGARVTKQEMYAMRYMVEFCGWGPDDLVTRFGVQRRYAVLNVIGHQTMAGVVPVEGVEPDDFSP